MNRASRRDDPGNGHRYDAACCSALAGCGQGKDADPPDDQGRTCLRRPALDLLRADLTAWGKLLEKDADRNGPVIVQQMQHWLSDPDFNGVRSAEALAKLPEAERADWHRGPCVVTRGRFRRTGVFGLPDRGPFGPWPGVCGDDG